MYKFHLCMLLLLSGLIDVSADTSISFTTRTRTIHFTPWNQTAAVSPSPAAASRLQTTEYWWIASADPVDDSLAGALNQAGASILGCAGRYPGGYVYKVRTRGTLDKAGSILRAKRGFLNWAPVTADDKINRRFLQPWKSPWFDSSKKTVRAVVQFHEDVTSVEMKMALINRVDSVFAQRIPPFGYRVAGTVEQLRNLAGLDIVSAIEPCDDLQPLLAEARTLTLVDSLQKGYFVKTGTPTPAWLRTVPYTGDSIWVCVNEPSTMGWPEPHIDFCDVHPNGDTLIRAPVPLYRWDRDWRLSGHGTHVAGIIAGNGWASSINTYLPADTMFWHGVAPKACILTSGERGDVNNHSFVEDDQAYYSWSAQGNDQLLANHVSDSAYDDNIGVHSAGNNGTRSQYGNAKGYYSLLVNNKNGIIVGATEKDTCRLAHFSSCGPTRDGRIKPDVVAPGTGRTGGVYTVEIDSIAIVNHQIKYCWQFNPGDPMWLNWSYGIYDIDQSGGRFGFKVPVGGYIFSDSIHPNPPVISQADDTLVVRWKVSMDCPKIPKEMVVKLFWKRPCDKYAKHDDPYCVMNFEAMADGAWHDIRVPLSDLSLRYSDQRWCDGDTIERIRLDFAHKQTGIVSCYPDIVTDYVDWSGTSMSGPHVTGIAALMLQQYRDSILYPRNKITGDTASIHKAPLWNSTVRGILIHTATDLVDTIGLTPGFDNPDFEAAGHARKHLYGPGPDWCTGWGLVNAWKAVKCVEKRLFRERTLDRNKTDKIPVTIPAGLPSLRVTIAWDDPAYINPIKENAYQRKLVNDLNLYLIDPQQRIYRPWVLGHDGMHDDTIPGDGLDKKCTPEFILSHGATRGIDSVNNVEVVDIDHPVAGTWQIVVSGAGIIMDQASRDGINQDYSLVLDRQPNRLTVVPEIRKLIRNCNNTVTAVFGYFNPNMESISLPKPSSRNQFTYHGTALLDFGQPVLFASGRVDSAFTVTFDGSALVWSLDGNNLTVKSPQSIKPGLIGVSYICNRGQYLATFTSTNNNTARVIVPAGCGNGFIYHGSSVADLGQVTEFRPGSKSDTFSVLFDGSRLVWKVMADSAVADSRGVVKKCMEPSVRAVYDNCDGTCTAVFDYFSPFDTIRELYSSDTNNYIVSSINGQCYYYGLPDRFTPGYVSNAAKLNFSRDDTLRWFLDGFMVTAERSMVKNPCPSLNLYKAFVFGKDSFTRPVPSDPSRTYTKIVQNGANFLYDVNRGYGYTNTAAIDPTPNDRGVYDGDDRIYNQFIGAQGTDRCITFRVDLPDGLYRFVAAGGDASNRHGTSLALGHYPDWYTVLMDGAVLDPGHFYRVGFDDKRPPAGDGSGVQPVFEPVRESPYYPIDQRPLLLAQVVKGTTEGGDLSLLEIWKRPDQLPVSPVLEYVVDNYDETYTAWFGYYNPNSYPVVIEIGERNRFTFDEYNHGQGSLFLPGRVRNAFKVTFDGNPIVWILNGHTSTASRAAVTIPRWTALDIGSPLPAGSSVLSGSEVTVQAGGADIWGVSDAFRYVYIQDTGFSTITARIDGITATNGWAKAGIMVRASLGAQSRHAFMCLTPSNGSAFQRRLLDGGSSYSTSGGMTIKPAWVRLTRNGDTLSGYQSIDGEHWTLAGKVVIVLPRNCYIGLATTSHANGKLTTALYREISVSLRKP